MVNRFLYFCYFCGSVVALIHASKGKKYDIKAFSNLNNKQKHDMQEVDANEKKHYEVVAGKLDQYLKDKGFNGSVLVASKDHVILRKGYGYANMKDKVFTTPRTKYRIGSITKTVVAISIMQLKERKIKY